MWIVETSEKYVSLQFESHTSASTICLSFNYVKYALNVEYVSLNKQISVPLKFRVMQFYKIPKFNNANLCV